MVEGDVPHQAWPTLSLGGLETACNEAHQSNKYLFIWDKQGNVGTFMQYKGQLAPLAGEIVKKALGRQTDEGIGEYVRGQFVIGMREGERLCIDIDKSAPNWEAMVSDGTFSLQFFNWEWMNQDANYLQYVRESENYGIGGLNPGHYNRSPNFVAIIRSGAEDEETLNSQISQIPNFKTHFRHVIIE